MSLNWFGPICFGLHLFTTEFHILNQVTKNLVLSKTIWTVPKWFWTNRRTRHRMHCLNLAVSHCSILVFHKSWVRPWRGPRWDRNDFFSFSWNKKYISIVFLTFPACFWIPIFFSNLNYNCSNSIDTRNLQERVKKAFCYQKLFWPCLNKLF